MDQWKVIGLVLLTVAASGCMDDGNQAGISVTELNVEPQSIRAGNSISVNVEAVNAGLLQGSVRVGESNGNQILTNYCPDYFDVEEFDASSSRTTEDQSIYDVGEGERIRLHWRLSQEGEKRIPLPGYTCSMKFEMPFTYTVKGYKQLQVLEDREVEGSPNLATDISAGPLSIDMRIVGSTAQQSNTILKEDDASLYLTAYNSDSEESPYQGLIEINDFSIVGSGAISLGDECGDLSSVALSSGNEEIYRCPIIVDEFSSPSARGEIDAKFNYTFVKDLGERNVEVKHDG
jgi:hypothetical protein